MLSTFRKRFILLTMLLTGTVLLSVLVAVGVYMYSDYYNELETTMKQVLAPQRDDRPGKHPDSRPRNSMRNDSPADAPDVLNEVPDDVLREKSKDIVSVFYYEDTGEISVTNNSFELDDSTVADVAVAAIASGEEYGTLYEYGLIFYVEGENGEYSIALAELWYIWISMINLIVILFLIFAASMGMIYIISSYTSKIAMKPLERSMELESRFIADASHELKTPLTVIMANNSILKQSEGLTFAQQRKWIDSTESAATRMMDMINDMLTLSSLEGTENTPSLRRTDLSSATTKAVLQMESVAYDKGIEYIQNISQDIFVNGDAQLIDRVFTSLIDNSLKYEPEGGKVSVSLETQKKKAVFSVTNFGSFICEEDLSHIFERFYRVDKSRSQGKGYGLGLSIVKQSVDLLGGDLSVESSPEEGTIFRVFFSLSD